MNFHLIPERIRIIWAIAKKDLKIAFRFPKNFLASQLIQPLKLFIIFGLVYQSFYVATGKSTIGQWRRMDYLPILLLGSIFYTSATYAFYRFRWAFYNEKYWKTIQALLIAPVSKLDFLIGSSIALVLELSVPVSCYVLLFCKYHPVSFPMLLFVLGILYLMILGILGISLMQGAFAISNENYLFVFDYFYAGLVFISCFFYSISAIPTQFQWLIQLNPVYHAVEIARTIVFHHLSQAKITFSMIYLSTFAVLMPVLGALFFRRMVRELGVRGF